VCTVQWLLTLLVVPWHMTHSTAPMRRMLQTGCPIHQIIVNGECVCGEGFYSSQSLVQVTVNGTGYQCLSSHISYPNLAMACSSSPDLLCPAYIPNEDPSSPANYVNSPYDGGLPALSQLVPDPWFRVDLERNVFINYGAIMARDYQMGAGVQMWVGDNPSYPSASGNALCYQHQGSGQGKDPNDFWIGTAPLYAFPCTNPVYGRYVFVTRSSDVQAAQYAAGNQFGIIQIYAWQATRCDPVTTQCTQCPNKQMSIPGSYSVSDCFVSNGLELNVTVDGTDTWLNQSTFDGKLPSNVQDIQYEDQVVVYIESCPAGYYCLSDTVKPTACPAGTFRDSVGATKLSDCLVCPAGSYCPIASITPTQCAAGRYRSTTGAVEPTDCVLCDTGKYCIQGSVTPVSCTAGTYRATTGGASVSDCLICPVGYYCGVATTTPTACAAGSYGPDSSAVSQADCVTCPSGQYCPVHSVAPTNCPAGTYRNGTGAGALSQCLACLVGEYCPTASTVPTACAAGTYRDAIGATAQADCSICPTGNYCPQQSVSPTVCPAGTYLNATGGTQETSCVPCDAGNYCPAGSVLPTQCPAGTFRDITGGIQLSSCYACPTGQYCPIMSVVPTSCLPGTYRATQSATQVTDCLACPAGQFCPFASTTPVDCPAGSYRGTTGGVDRFSCTTCPSGNYCPEASVNPINCTAGTYRAVAGAVQSSDCLACPAGDYCPVATTNPTSCPGGTYRASVGAAQLSDCIACPNANFCPIQTSTPHPCAPGSYRATTGGIQQSDCAACTTGHYCPVASSAPTNCPAGTYRITPSGSSVADCLPCPAGLYCPVQTTNPTPCAAGTYRATSGATQQSDCTICPAGSYCPVQTVRPTQCSAGTHRDTTGAAHLSDCLLCVPGTFSLQVGRTTNCPLCDANFYCRTSTTKDVCPLHTTSSAGSYSRVNCICDPGYQCTYYKEIQAIVTLNATLWEFQNDINGVRTAFISAMAAAAGVQPSQVTINDVLTQSGRRRLLSDRKEGGMIDVHASVTGSVQLRDLDKHLDRHIEKLHVSHTWKQAPQVRAVALATFQAVKAPVPAKGKPGLAAALKAKDARPAQAASLKRVATRDLAKERLLQLVDREKLIQSLNEI